MDSQETTTKPGRGRLRWKRRAPSSGLRRMVEPRVHEYTDGVEVFAIVQGDRSGNLWFWYGMGENTSSRPVATAEAAKEEAEQHVKASLKADSGTTPRARRGL